MIEVGREYIDDLTGLYNRRFLRVKSGEYFQTIDSEASTTSILLIDLDYFKNVNDTYGHSKGDTVLKEFSSFLEDLLRGNDSVFRYGGDEFVCVLPGTGYEQAERISHRFIEKCRETEFSRIRLTMSIGIASCPDDGKEWVGLFDIADQRLYSAKRHGRDRIGVPETDVRRLIIPTEEIVGRNDELSEVMRYAGSSSDIQGGTFCISGEIGVGKSRFVREIIDSERFMSFRFLGSMLSATTHSIPYFPFRELIRSIIRMSDGLDLEDIPQTYRIELTKIVPELSDYLADRAGEVLMVDKFRLFEGVRRLLEQQVAGGPLIISIDNIHWADEGSLELLHYIIRAFRSSPILFLLIYRVEEAGRECFQRILNNMSREGLFNRIILEPLDEPDVSRMLSMIIDRIPSHSLTGYIYRKTGGNPFFIEELMKSLHESGAFYWNSDVWEFREDMAGGIPHSIEDVIDRKLGLMSAEARSLIEHAAVIGREFDFGFLLEMTEWNEGQLFDMMDEAKDVGLLKEYGGERFFFSEDVIREVVYNRINGIKRGRLHLAIAGKILDSHREKVEQVVEDLSLHFYLGGDTDRALKYSISAGDKARESYAYREAVEYYNRAFECFDKKDTGWNREKIECLMNRAVALSILGENEQAIHELQEVIKQSSEISDIELEVDGLLHICKPYLDTAEYDKALETAEKAERISRGIDNMEKLADSLDNSGLSCWHLGRYHDALKYYEQSIRILEETDGKNVSPSTLNNIGAVYWNLGKYNRAMDYFKRSLKITEQIGDWKTNSACLNNCGLIYWGFCEYRKALEYFMRSLEITERIGNRNSIAANLNNIGKAYEFFGEYQTSIDFFKRSLMIAREIGDRRTESAILANMGDINRILGKFEESLDLISNSLIIRGNTGDRRGVMECLIGKGDTLAMMNNLESARECYIQSREIAVEIDAVSQIKGLDINILSLNLEENRLEGLFDGIANILLPPSESVGKSLKGQAHQLAGRLHSRKHDWRRSAEFFEKSAVIFTELDDSYNLAITLFYRGQMCEESGDKSGSKECYSRA
ncbi:MAG: tetratricopeptide repeat protein, partial [Candidatus Aegiribacteria sp.]|nr:tetratricopeptide repeat protein [Candidatus Aegiribacteria sp.]